MERVVQFTHSSKLEETVKGVRISVHVYSSNQEQVIEEALNTYLKAKMTVMDNKIPLPPVGDNKKCTYGYS
jgi:hypothetical protein